MLTLEGKFAGLPRWVSQRRFPMLFTVGALVAAVSAISAAAFSACAALSLVRFARQSSQRGFSVRWSRMLGFDTGSR